MSRTARVMVFNAPGQPLQLHEYELPRLQAGEVLVRITCSTLCGSDVHTFEGRRSTPCPTVLGHEILGSVAALPDAEKVLDYDGCPLQIGDRITWSVAASCGNCFYCKHGLPQKCEYLFKYGHERITSDHPLSGGLADYCHLAKGTAIFRVPDALPDRVACPANCATATVAAAMRYGGACADRVVLVQGAGMLGLTSAAMARINGAREVIVCDVAPKRVKLAESFGATRTVIVDEDCNNLRNLVRELTSDRGVYLALEMSGAASAIELGIDLLGIGGKYVWVGATFPGRPVSISAERVVRKLLTIQGVHNYAPEDLATALQFLQRSQHQFPFERLVGEAFPLEEANDAFSHAVESGALRIAVQP